ncbi:MAG: DUF370 domain-containing protein [Deltaproteobacteria bacterium]|jgi:regulator of extracellular matrix RemA (YlzA/DUF370 family)|nr:DUF370 domain-containing protein [Deltaproteobacteria bacterium]
MPSFLVNLGYNHFVSAERVVAVVNSNSVPAKRLRDEAKEQNFLLDATANHKVRSIVVTSSKHVILSALEVNTLVNRCNETNLKFLKATGLKPGSDQLETVPDSEPENDPLEDET